MSSKVVPLGGGLKVIDLDHKVYFASFDDTDPAYYVCALLNSELVRSFIDSFTIKIQVGPLFRHVKLPPFDPSSSDHLDLVRYSKDAHDKLEETEGVGPIDEQKKAIDRLADQILARTSSLKYRALEFPW